MSKTLNKEEILEIQDQVIERVEVPEWGGASVFVRSISAAERGLVEAAAARFKESRGRDDSFVRNFTVKLAGMGICDEQGNRLFDDKEISRLAEKNAAAIGRISEAVQRLSGLSADDIEALAKNSEDAQPEDSRSV